MLSRRSLLLFSVACLAWFAACGPSLAQVSVITDIPYKRDGATEYERTRCKLDLYLPESKQGFATIVWFHGGGLKNGDKSGEIAVSAARRFAGDGVAVACVNYRLSPQATFPAYIDDAAAAVAFVRKEIASHGGSASRVFVSGHSAGGYLTAMVGLNPRYLKKYGLEPSDMAGYLPISGQMVTHSTVRGERGISETQPVIDSAAPAWHVHEGAPPFLCIAGSEDLPARAEENRYFVAALRATGNQPVRYLEFAGRTHGTIANRLGEAGDEVARAINEFIASAR